jgi:endonuclease G
MKIMSSLPGSLISLQKQKFRAVMRNEAKTSVLTKTFQPDQPHSKIIPGADTTPVAMSESFLLSNMSPQEQGFNRGVWSRLETKVRDWAVKNDSILVITGPVLKGINKYIGENRVGVPDYYFKVIADISAPSYKVIAFLLGNRSSSDNIMKYAVSIDSLERITGYDFFPDIPDKGMAERMEKNIYTRLWK